MRGAHTGGSKFLSQNCWPGHSMSSSQGVAGAWHWRVRRSHTSGSTHVTQDTFWLAGHSLASSTHCTLDSQRPTEALQKVPGPHWSSLMHCTQRLSGSQNSPVRQVASLPAATHSRLATSHCAPVPQVLSAEQRAHCTETCVHTWLTRSQISPSSQNSSP